MRMKLPAHLESGLGALGNTPGHLLKARWGDLSAGGPVDRPGQDAVAVALDVAPGDVPFKDQTIGAVPRPRGGGEAYTTAGAEKALDEERALLPQVKLAHPPVAVGLDLTGATGRAMALTRFLPLEALSLFTELKISKCSRDKDFGLKQQP